MTIEDTQVDHKFKQTGNPAPKRCTEAPKQEARTEGMSDQGQVQTPLWELREKRRRCWYDECDRTAVLDWCGWKYCLRHYWSQVLRDAEGLTHKYVKLRYTRIMWRHLNPAAAWWRRQRKTDLEVLWVALKAASPTIKEARAAFLNHCIQDPAWHDLSYAEIVSLIEHLE